MRVFVLWRMELVFGLFVDGNKEENKRRFKEDVKN
jgi:hypothetical protein